MASSSIDNALRIVSLVPSATELLFALGLGQHIVGVTHECDYPEAALELPQLTHSVLQPGLTQSEIDRAVKDRTQAGQPLYGLDNELLVELEPTLIVAQELCEVCAVSLDDVRSAATKLPQPAQLMSLDPTTVGEVLADMRALAVATGVIETAEIVVDALADRIDDVKIALREVGPGLPVNPPRVAALEWLDPPFTGGHWIPQMIELAGGVDLLGAAGERSAESSWDALAASEPEVVVVMPCGFGMSGAVELAQNYAEQISRLGASRTFACDASSYFSRPGPRLVDGLEMLAHAFHPDLVPEPEAGRMLALELVAD